MTAPLEEQLTPAKDLQGSAVGVHDLRTCGFLRVDLKEMSCFCDVSVDEEREKVVKRRRRRRSSVAIYREREAEAGFRQRRREGTRKCFLPCVV